MVTADDKKKLEQIRCGKFVAQSYDNFALSFRVIRERDGVPRTLSIHGGMPVIITKWEGSRHPEFMQSLQ